MQSAFLRNAMVLYPLPAGTVLGVGNLDALRFQLVPDAVGLGKILCLLCLIPLHHQRVNSGIALTGDGVPACGLSALSLGSGCIFH